MKVVNYRNRLLSDFVESPYLWRFARLDKTSL